MLHVRSFRVGIFSIAIAALLVLAPSTAAGQYWHGAWWATYGYPWGPYGYGPSPYGYVVPVGYGYFPVDVTAAVRLQVTPVEAEVFVDGYSAGVVDDFDGVFQRLRLYPGGHEIVVYLDGYRTFRQNLYVNPGSSQTIRHALEPLAPGENMDARPSPTDPRPQVPPPGSQDSPNSSSNGPPQVEPGRQPEGTRRNEFGMLSIRVEPGAVIHVNGQRWTAPVDSSRLFIELAPGRYDVDVRKPGFSVFRETVLVRPGATMNLNVGLKPE